MKPAAASDPIMTVVSVGSNIEPGRNIPGAIEAIGAAFGKLRISPTYRTSAVGFEGPPFLNLVVAFDTTLPVAEVISQLRDIEAKAGRERGEKSFNSRTLDLDVILYGSADLRDSGYNIPRDEIMRYAYVLQPLADLLPETLHPLLQKSYAELRAQFGDREQLAERIDGVSTT